MVISAIFNRISENKKKQETQEKPLQRPMPKKTQYTTEQKEIVQKQAPASRQEKQYESPFDKLKELSRDFYKEIEKEFNDTTKVEQKKVETKQHVAEQVSTAKQQAEQLAAKELVMSKAEKSQEQAQLRSRSKVASKKKKDLIPSHSDDIMKGVIFAEIIGPPKSKR